VSSPPEDGSETDDTVPSENATGTDDTVPSENATGTDDTVPSENATGTDDAVRPGDGSERDSKPDWWSVNEALREEMGLHEYDPPRFADGTYTHEVVDPLEAEYDCTIQFRSDVNPEYPEDWQVRVDHEPVTRIARHRNADGNTVYDLTAEEFRESVLECLERD
jgi:hypothetical protein